MSIWFTSDTHYGHENIIRHCGRPYKSSAKMNFDMIRRWNDVVQSDDIVYHIGDFAMGDPTHWSHYCGRLRGRKVLVRGNHDQDTSSFYPLGLIPLLGT